MHRLERLEAHPFFQDVSANDLAFRLLQATTLLYMSIALPANVTIPGIFDIIRCSLQLGIHERRCCGQQDEDYSDSA